MNDPSRRTAFANGQYILIRREAYRAVGGYESVRTEIVEDIALARRVKGLGHRLWNVIGTDLFTTRMYDSLRAMYKGWTRIYYGAFKRIPLMAGVMLATFVFTLAPFAAFVASAVAVASGPTMLPTRILLGLSAAICLLIVITMRRYFIVGRANPWYLLFYPAAVVLVLWFQAGAMVRALGLRGVTWRGTTYKGGKVVGGGQ